MDSYSPLSLPPSPYHEEGVSDPQAPPSPGAGRDAGVLAVHGDGHGGRLADGAAADVGPDLLGLHGHHGDGGGGGQPVGLVVAAAVVAHVVGVAVDEGDGLEARQARARQTCRGLRVIKEETKEKQKQNHVN